MKQTESKYTIWTKDRCKKYIRKSNKEGILLGIFLSSNGKHLGNIRLSNINITHKRVELGILIYNPKNWNKGYGTEALFEVDKWIFGFWGFHKICADYYSINQASAKMFKKAGYKIEGIFKDHFYMDNKYIDSIRVAKIK